MSMSHGLEVRVPYLDPDLVVTAFNISAARKIHFSSTKSVLRKIAKSYVPSSITKRRQHGFLVPLISVFQDDLILKPNKKSYLRESLKAASEIIDADRAIKVLMPKGYLTQNASVKLWLLVMVSLCISQFRLSIK